jgi:hypothetical protein
MKSKANWSAQLNILSKSTAPVIPDLENCSEEWAEHRKQTRIVWVLFAGWIPYGALSFMLLNWLHLAAAIWVAIILYVIVLVVFSVSVSNFACPRCGERFYAWGRWGLGHNSFARKCGNCGLRKWQCE